MRARRLEDRILYQCCKALAATDPTEIAAAIEGLRRALHEQTQRIRKLIKFPRSLERRRAVIDNPIDLHPGKPSDRRSTSMSRKSGKPTRPWEKIAQQITQEHDPDELLALAEKLNEAMLTEEREKVQRRSGIVADSRLA